MRVIAVIGVRERDLEKLAGAVKKSLVQPLGVPDPTSELLCSGRACPASALPSRDGDGAVILIFSQLRSKQSVAVLA